MLTFDRIKSVNERIKKIEVKGKAYACVPARVQAFREICPNGSIETEIVSMEDGIVTMKTTVRDENGAVLATGMAQEKEASSYINKTSYIENCETSAVGRALGFLGLGSEEQMASAEELANAVFNQSLKGGPKQTGFVCSDCGLPVRPARFKDGKTMTAEEVAKESEARFGRQMCAACARKAETAAAIAHAYEHREDGDD